ncbi:MAG: hypothetical protein PHS03_10470 [Sphaerochaeta sp.]|uniref:hypothetical protein n=1 Tax=uncultured Sphaerochaeta sp. TaxID=886478 RepID=UPI002A0A62ED|nr:hypothetical protein [uncultured Sphaerochaeta sp.]MDD4302892.1 hypothetical protein [Sphaerochaeta sp.]
MQKQKCSYCGSEDVDIREDQVEVSEPFADVNTVTVKMVVCNTCGFAEDHESNDCVLQDALAVCKQSSMVHTLTYLNAQGYTNASMERSLGLPARTLARWKNEDIVPSAAALALMRFIRTFPWLLRVAEKEFDQEKAHEVVLSEGEKEIRKRNHQDMSDCKNIELI